MTFRYRFPCVRQHRVYLSDFDVKKIKRIYIKTNALTNYVLPRQMVAVLAFKTSRLPS